MSTRLCLASWLLAAAALLPQPAGARPGRAAAPLADPVVRAAVDWRPIEVIPVALPEAAVWTAEPEPAAVPVRALVIGPDTGAVVRLASLATLHIHAEPVKPGQKPPPPPRFWRRTGDLASGRAAVLEPAVEVSPGTWLLEHPPGGAGDWLITAAEPTRITALTPTPRTGELIWEHVAGAILDWIAVGGPLPPLPELPALEPVRRDLLADAAIAAALLKTDPKDSSLQHAVQAWRAAAALQRIAALRPAQRPFFALETAPRPLAGATLYDLDGRTWQRTATGKTWDLTFEGPGVAWISAKQLGHDPKASISITAGGRRLADARLAARAPCQPDVLPCPEAGRRRDLAIPLAPGRHTYRLHLDADGALLHVRAGRTLERLAGALRPDSVRDLVRRADRALGRTTSPRAGLVRALLALVDGGPIDRLRRPQDPALLLTYHWLDAQQTGLPPARRHQLARDLARAAERVRDPELAARARAAGMDMLQGTADVALARRLIGPLDRASARALATLGPLVDGPALPLASPALALFERARRHAPHDPDLRAAYRDHWRLTRWSTLQPSEGDVTPLLWIDRLPADPERAATSASLWTWPQGQAHTILAPALPEAPTRPALLRLYARVDPGAGLTVAVDDRRWRTLPLTALEPVALALPPGPHTLELAGPADAEVWSSLPPDPARPPEGRLLRQWSADPKRPARLILPGEPAFARVDIRSLDADIATHAELTIKTDTGLRRELHVELRPADHAALPLAGAPRLGPATSILVPLDLRAHALEIHVARGGPRVAVSAAVRAPGLAEVAPEDVSSDTSKLHVPKDIPTDPLEVVEQTSRALLTRPGDPDLLLTRAAALLDLDQRAYALSDWTRLSARPLPPALRLRGQALGARIEALGSPRHIDVTTEVPVLVAPALAAAGLDDADLARFGPAAARARTHGPAAALAALAALEVAEDLSQTTNHMSPGTPGAGASAPLGLRLPARPVAALDPAAEAFRASLLDLDDHPEGAFRAWHRVYAVTGQWQVGLAGAMSALAAMDGPTTAPDGAALAYGLALRVRPEIRTPGLARLTTIAGERSRWSHLILSEERSSREKVDLPRLPKSATVTTDVRAALLAAPFPTEGALLLRPGVPVLFDLARGHLDLEFDLWCREVRPELGGQPALIRFWMGEELLHTQPVADATVAVAGFTVPARDAVTLELDDDSHAHHCVARLRRPEARLSATTDRWHIARARRPVEFIVLGPTTVQIEVHGRPASDIKLALARGSGPFGPAHPLSPIDNNNNSTKDNNINYNTTPPIQILTLADSGPLRMRLAPGVGAARVRLHQRLDAEPRPVPARPSRRRPATLAQDPPLPPQPGERPALAAVALAPERRIQRFGTPYAEFRMGTDDLEDSDDLRPRISGVVRLGWARELLARRLWLEVAPELRPRHETALVAGGALTLQAFFPRAGLRAWLRGSALVQTEHPTSPWSARVEARLDRPTWLAPRLQLLPGLDLAYRHQSLDPGHGWARGELHPRVYQWYVEDHPLLVRPTLDLRVVPWQDARLVVGADMAPNSDFRSVDQVSVHAGIAGALALYGRVVPEFVFDYEASLRLKDDDRSKTYLRSRILAGLGLGVWASDRVRFAFGVRNSLYLSAPYPARNGLDLWLRIDLPLGRGLRDYGPLEMPFRAAREHRMWRQEPTP